MRAGWAFRFCELGDGRYSGSSEVRGHDSVLERSLEEGELT